MVQKRHFDEDDSNEVSFKQPRQLELESRLTSTWEFPCEPFAQSPRASGEADNYLAELKPECNEKLDVSYDEHSSCPKEDLAVRASISLPCSSWDASDTNEEERWPGEPFHILGHADYNNDACSPMTNVNPGDIYSYLLDHSPRKLVPVGPEFQADIPEWGANGYQRTFSCLDDTYEALNLPSHAPETIQVEKLGGESRLVGNCIIPRPDSIHPTESGHVGLGRTDCSCEEIGSIRCIQLHIFEARDKLKRILGPEAYCELGFCDMGEVVAEKWSEEEEHLFHEVIFSNPTSSGKNFWDHLAFTFPSRTQKEIVSYYFNVFMLRRRMVQNRSDPMTIDSDNEELQGDCSDYESEVDEYDNCAHDEDIDCKNVGVLGQSPDQLHSKCSSDDIPDTSYKSDNVVPDPKVALGKGENYKQWTGHEIMLEPCSAREWDLGYMTCPRNEVDLLPTCSMIEEFFGAGSWNHNSRDGQQLR